MAHEFGHMCQWFFNESVWTACDIGKHDAAEIIVEWEAGKDFDDDIVTKAFRAVREIEADADTKALEYIKDWQLPVNTHTYIRESKNYDYSYRMMQVNRKWKYFRRH